jgi:hypothetical protein
VITFVALPVYPQLRNDRSSLRKSLCGRQIQRETFEEAYNFLCPEFKFSLPGCLVTSLDITPTHISLFLNKDIDLSDYAFLHTKSVFSLTSRFVFKTV